MRNRRPRHWFNQTQLWMTTINHWLRIGLSRSISRLDIRQIIGHRKLWRTLKYFVLFILKPLLNRFSFDVICCQPSDAMLKLKGCCRHWFWVGLSVSVERSPNSRLSHVCYIKTSIGSLSMKSAPTQLLHHLIGKRRLLIVSHLTSNFCRSFYGIISLLSPILNPLNSKGYGTDLLYILCSALIEF